MYNAAYKKSLETKAHKQRNKTKLWELLDVGQKLLMENHSIDNGSSKKQWELRSGHFMIARKSTNVSYKTQLDSDQTIKKTVHGNHLIDYFPIEEKAKELINDYFLKKQSNKKFHENLMQSRNKFVKIPLTNKSFQNAMTSSE